MEIEKILQSLSTQAASCSRELEENQKILTKLDFIFAKAKYAKEYQGTEPIFNTDGIVDIKQGRHPLLDLKKSFQSIFILARTLICFCSPDQILVVRPFP